MTRIRRISIVMALTTIFSSCNTADKKNELLILFDKYHKASEQSVDGKWNYTTDTVKVWFDNKDNKPLLKIKGMESAGQWKEWDNEMNSKMTYDSLWFDEEDNAVKGYFYENNDFYRLIKKPPTKTLRTYWFNSADQIDEILIYWIPNENTPTEEFLRPIQEWALKYDSQEIQELYPDETIVPSRENAMRWKILLQEYNSK